MEISLDIPVPSVIFSVPSVFCLGEVWHRYSENRITYFLSVPYVELLVSEARVYLIKQYYILYNFMARRR
jgi:hypothetical protein